MSNLIAPSTKISIGYAAAVASVFLGGALWINNNLHGLDARLARIEAALTTNVTQRDFDIWANKLRQENPAIRVPML